MTEVQASWLMSAPVAVPRMPRGGSVSPAYFVTCRSSAEDTDGPPMTAAMQRNRFSERLLQARREALASTAKHLRNQMRCSEASTCEAELRAVTHELLAQGCK